MNRISMILATSLIIFDPASLASAQGGTDRIRETYFWLDGGLGDGSLGESTTFHMSILGKIGLISARYSVFEGNLGSIAWEPESYYGEDYYLNDLTEIALLYGRAYQTDYWIASASIGLSILRADLFTPREGPVDKALTSAIGIPFQAQLFVTPLSAVGVGLTITSNMNELQSYTSTTLSVRIGVLRYVPGK